MEDETCDCDRQICIVWEFLLFLWIPPEARRSSHRKENLDVMSRLVFSAGFTSPALKPERKQTPRNSDVSVIAAH